jgi:hypothetical protein
MRIGYEDKTGVQAIPFPYSSILAEKKGQESVKAIPGPTMIPAS